MNTTLGTESHEQPKLDYGTFWPAVRPRLGNFMSRKDAEPDFSAVLHYVEKRADVSGGKVQFQLNDDLTTLQLSQKISSGRLLLLRLRADSLAPEGVSNPKMTRYIFAYDGLLDRVVLLFVYRKATDSSIAPTADIQRAVNIYLEEFPETSVKEDPVESAREGHLQAIIALLQTADGHDIAELHSFLLQRKIKGLLQDAKFAGVFHNDQEYVYGLGDNNTELNKQNDYLRNRLSLYEEVSDFSEKGILIPDAALSILRRCINSCSETFGISGMSFLMKNTLPGRIERGPLFTAIDPRQYIDLLVRLDTLGLSRERHMTTPAERKLLHDVLELQDISVAETDDRITNVYVALQETHKELSPLNGKSAQSEALYNRLWELLNSETPSFPSTAVLAETTYLDETYLETLLDTYTEKISYPYVYTILKAFFVEALRTKATDGLRHMYRIVESRGAFPKGALLHQNARNLLNKYAVEGLQKGAYSLPPAFAKAVVKLLEASELFREHMQQMPTKMGFLKHVEHIADYRDSWSLVPFYVFHKEMFYILEALHETVLEQQKEGVDILPDIEYILRTLEVLQEDPWIFSRI